MGPMRNPVLTEKLFKSLKVFANYKRIAQYSCVSSHGPKNGRLKYFSGRSIVALHLPNWFPVPPHIGDIKRHSSYSAESQMSTELATRY